MYDDLSSTEECSDTWAYATSFNSNANFTETGSWDDIPQGCIIYDSGNMYFNSNSNGITAYNIRSLCKKNVNK